MNADGPLLPQDLHLLAAVRDGAEWTRAVLCTLARRGAALRLSDPDRARALLDVLAPLPYYKAGQFLFDLLEWEDFMLDGPPARIVNSALDSRALQNLAFLLDGVRRHLDGASEDLRPRVRLEPAAAEPEPEPELPPLVGSIHLYDDVVLGGIARLQEAGQPAGGAAEA